MTKRIVIWDGTGDALQGDVCLFAIPPDIEIDMDEEIEPRNGLLILAEGEVTGHHHAIGLAKYTPQPTHFHDSAQARANTSAPPQNPLAPTIGTAKLYRARKAIRALERAGYLTTTALAIGVLVVARERVNLGHEEHDTYSIPPGNHYVGNQREWDEAQERRLAD